jgi:hypothetical protein
MAFQKFESHNCLRQTLLGYPKLLSCLHVFGTTFFRISEDVIYNIKKTVSRAPEGFPQTLANERMYRVTIWQNI